MDIVVNDIIYDSEFLQTFIDAVPSLLFVVDSDVRVIHLNQTALEATGSQRGKVLMQRGGDILHCVHSLETVNGCGYGSQCPQCALRNAVGKASCGNEVHRMPVAMKVMASEKTENVYFNVTATPLSYKGSVMVLLVLDDVTEQKKVEKALIDSDERLRNIMAVMGEGVFVLDEKGFLTFMNPEAERLLGWKASELQGRHFHPIIHSRRRDGSHRGDDECSLLKTIRTGEPYYVAEDVLMRKDGVIFPVSFACNPIREGDRITGAVAAFHDITKIRDAHEALKRANQLLARQATTDPLTGIYNRLKFDEVLMKEISRSRRHEIPLSLVMFDIDHFKAINDTCGHHIGDAVLQELSAYVLKHVRKHDYFARWGGEEFMILLTHSTVDTAWHFAEGLRAGIESLRMRGTLWVTCSFGVAQMNRTDDIFSLAKRADDALYKAKSAGRNTVEVLP